jgi:hypothetical protein
MAASVAALAAFASTASAGSEYFGAHYISAQWAWATVSAHSQVYNVYTTSDHTCCPSLSQGNSGLFYAPGQNIIHGECAYGTKNWWPSPQSGYWHGTAYNPNQATTDYVSDGGYFWGS